MPVCAYILTLREYPEGHCEVERAFLNECADVFGEGGSRAEVGLCPDCDLTEVDKRHGKYYCVKCGRTRVYVSW